MKGLTPGSLSPKTSELLYFSYISPKAQRLGIPQPLVDSGQTTILEWTRKGELAE